MSLFSQLMHDPLAVLDANYDEVMHLPVAEIAEFQKSWARKRFDEMAPKIPTLGKLAAEQGITTIEKLDDIAPLLFPHTVYKSYPISWIEKASFDKMTRWLNGLTVHDIKGVDMSGVETIDDWIKRLDQETEVRVFHSSGTTGKLSFVPRTRRQHVHSVLLSATIIRDWRGANSGPDAINNPLPAVLPSYRHGASAGQRRFSAIEEALPGEVLYLYPDARFSADIASLAGRLRIAESRGEQGALEVSPALLARRGELLELEKSRQGSVERFFGEARERFAGQSVQISATMALIYEWAEQGLALGQSGLFGSGGTLWAGGGKKGQVWPDDWRDRLIRFLGFDNVYEFYSVSEVISRCMLCEHDHFHFPPTLIPFLLDPRTGQLLDRSTHSTGRLGFLDLMVTDYWSGLITGDEVTISKDGEQCACGRTGLFLQSGIRRYSEQEGGDDKITCAGAPEAHDHALAFLQQLAG